MHRSGHRPRSCRRRTRRRADAGRSLPSPALTVTCTLLNAMPASVASRMRKLPSTLSALTRSAGISMSPLAASLLAAPSSAGAMYPSSAIASTSRSNPRTPPAVIGNDSEPVIVESSSSRDTAVSRMSFSRTAAFALMERRCNASGSTVAGGSMSSVCISSLSENVATRSAADGCSVPA